MRSLVCVAVVLFAGLIIVGCTSYGPSQANQIEMYVPEAVDTDKSPAAPGEPFRFTVMADNRPKRASRRAAFQWTLQEMNRLVDGEGAFVLMAGDFDPPWMTDHDFRAAFGADMLWYPAVGNHDAENRDYMAWVRDRSSRLPFIVRQGPPGSETTTYSFDYGSAHFIVLNQYYTGQDDHSGKGDVCDGLYEWLRADLEATDRPVIFVVGHEPAYPQGRHVGNSLDQYRNNRDRFWKLLNDRGVIAFFCGHTHSYGRLQQGSSEWPTVTWQVDAGNCGQGRTQTFVDVSVSGDVVVFDTYCGSTNKEFTKCDTWTVPIGQVTTSVSGPTGEALSAGVF